MIRGSVLQEDTTVLNAYALKKYMKQKVIEQQGEIRNYSW